MAAILFTYETFFCGTGANAASDKMIEDCLGAPAASKEIAHFTRGQPSWQAMSFRQLGPPDQLHKQRMGGGIKERRRPEEDGRWLF
ncbi:hypothetical protein OUZ56_003992 [Daphnia magna]|uniref:Uncharacterized protein n=1 Tax=Daphnia magna TaxID=35525 RepID=A0ABQ9YNF3_9CRUS|nr:hypothetical protein OUZ56_003992 [Daphnia magna]